MQPVTMCPHGGDDAARHCKMADANQHPVCVCYFAPSFHPVQLRAGNPRQAVQEVTVHAVGPSRMVVGHLTYMHPLQVCAGNMKLMFIQEQVYDQGKGLPTELQF